MNTLSMIKDSIVTVVFDDRVNHTHRRWNTKIKRISLRDTSKWSVFSSIGFRVEKGLAVGAWIGYQIKNLVSNYKNSLL